jgi:hypothetical protein
MRAGLSPARLPPGGILRDELFNAYRMVVMGMGLTVGFKIIQYLWK